MTKLKEINPQILEWVVNYSNESSVLILKFPKLNSWIKKDDFPTLKQLEKFSKVTAVPFGYFFLNEIPKVTLPIPFFRTLKMDIHPYEKSQEKSYSPELIDTLRIIGLRQEWLKEYLITKGYEPLRFVGSANITNDYKIISNSIRNQLKLDENWAEKQHTWLDALNYLLEKTENVGINVVRNGIIGNNTHRKLDFNEFRGFVMVDEIAPFVFLNGNDFKSAQMFTLAHELAHVWLGSSAIFDLRELLPAENPTEILCNKVAAEFLVPEKSLNEKWITFKKTKNPYFEIASFFKVSEIVAARRVLDLNLISKKEFLDFYNKYISKEYKVKKKEGGDFYNTQPFRIGKRFANAVFTAVKEGSLLYREAYRLTDLNASSFQEFEKRFNPLSIGNVR